ncbi:MAG: twin-arginine translocase TatA/TatE family subunit [Coriobacteriia bacterium]|nr:twin-arginine translocase TatA/TatE family subunit [Coriobacteriia bacterium]
MRTMGFMEIMIIIVAAIILFVVFGPKNLPKLGKMFGTTMKEVRKGMAEANEAMNDTSSNDASAAPTPTPVAPTSAEASPQTTPTAAPADSAATIDPNRKVAKIIYEDEE